MLKKKSYYFSLSLLVGERFKEYMMMMMNCFCGMVDRQKTFSFIPSWDHCQRSSPWQISDMPGAGFELAQNLSSGLVEWSSAIEITTTPWGKFWNFALLFNAILVLGFFRFLLLVLDLYYMILSYKLLCLQRR